MTHALYTDGPRLLADIGGTNARFALEHGPGAIDSVRTLSCAAHARFEDAVRAYLAAQGVAVRHAVIAIANPVNGDLIKMTNHHWTFSTAAARRELGLATLLVVNDFTALAMALPALGPLDVHHIGGGKSQPHAVLGLVGAGTGLGVSGLIPSGGRWVALQSEGGHVAFAPGNEREVEVLRYCWQRYDHVSAERLVSGPGIALIREALAASRGIAADLSLSTAAIVERGLSNADPLCRETIDCFSGMLGAVAADLAVTLGAQGGIYIGGGVVPRLGDYFADSPFRARFEKKGRFSAFTAGIPTMLITAPFPGLTGAAVILSEHMNDHAGHVAPAPVLPARGEHDHAHC